MHNHINYRIITSFHNKSISRKYALYNNIIILIVIHKNYSTVNFTIVLLIVLVFVILHCHKQEYHFVWSGYLDKLDSC